ncbi:MAG: UDP-N-acetylmuramoyl-tripeptide--D-alanyl-D-alanine ligase [Gemmatimonadetes bacterium]|nr:UDP-N-acetylmuramoyl-tripeptide--D-alanyl-D-alanine ligase [Gemmatimonadota bacterium]
MIWTSKTVAATLNTDAPAARSFSEISTDSRTLRRDALFVALVGERFDGHAYLAAARDTGAAGAVVRRGTPSVDGLVFFEVDDPQVALGELARARRREVVGPVVAVTGTNGKTATKEMLAKVLGTRWRVHATTANLNNLIGVPKTILSAPDSCEALVVEVGANIVGEIDMLRHIIEPTVAVVTNVSAGHLAGFGTLEGVLAEKASLASGVAVAVVGTRPPALRDEVRRRAARVVTAGIDGDPDIGAASWSVNEKGETTFTVGEQQIDLSAIGRHNVENALLAVAVALELELDMGQVARALEDVRLPGGRCEVAHHGALTILNDTYNANPESLKASLQTAAALRGDRPFVVVVGSMLELGSQTVRLHKESAEEILRENPTLIGATGDFVEAFEALDVPASRIVVSRDVEELGSVLRSRLEGNEFVLVKASRGVRLERVIPLLTKENEV